MIRSRAGGGRRQAKYEHARTVCTRTGLHTSADGHAHAHRHVLVMLYGGGKLHRGGGVDLGAYRGGGFDDEEFHGALHRFGIRVKGLGLNAKV